MLMERTSPRKSSPFPIPLAQLKTAYNTSAWPFVLAAFALSRLFFLGAGAVAAATLPWTWARPDGHPPDPQGILAYWAHWDGGWYSLIATEGYGARAPESTAFFPLFPMLIRAGTTLGGGPALWGVFISLVATLFALYFLYRIAEKLQDVKAARAATLAFAFFPTAFFLNAVYTEALFAALALGSFWAVYVRRDLLLAVVFGAFASATRNLGLLLLIPLAYEWLRNRQEFGWRGAMWMAFVPTGLLGYMVFLWARFGDPFLFASQQSDYWSRHLTNPMSAMAGAWTYAAEGGLKYILDPTALFLDPDPQPWTEAYSTLAFGFLLLLAFLVGVGFVLLPPGLSMYAFLSMLVPILTPDLEPEPFFVPLLCLPRYLLDAFPLFLSLGFLLSRSKLALYPWLIISGSVGLACTALFVTWRLMP